MSLSLKFLATIQSHSRHSHPPRWSWGWAGLLVLSGLLMDLALAALQPLAAGLGGAIYPSGWPCCKVPPVPWKLAAGYGLIVGA